MAQAGRATLLPVDVHNITHWGNTVRPITLGVISHEGPHGLA
jgi:hypothetical protein